MTRTVTHVLLTRSSDSSDQRVNELALHSKDLEFPVEVENSNIAATRYNIWSSHGKALIRQLILNPCFLSTDQWRHSDGTFRIRRPSERFVASMKFWTR